MHCATMKFYWNSLFVCWFVCNLGLFHDAAGTVKFTLEQGMKAQREKGGVALLIL